MLLISFHQSNFILDLIASVWSNDNHSITSKMITRWPGRYLPTSGFDLAKVLCCLVQIPRRCQMRNHYPWFVSFLSSIWCITPEISCWKSPLCVASLSIYFEDRASTPNYFEQYLCTWNLQILQLWLTLFHLMNETCNFRDQMEGMWRNLD